MSAEGDSESDSGPGRREVAYRLFAAEFDDASLSYSESDEERAPNYVLTPTGLRVNRLFAVGVLTEVERVNTETLRGRIVDPTGAFVTYAGQYQPAAQAFLDGATPPAFVAITGKARTFEPDDGDRVFTSVRPESLSEVTADTRDRWVVSAAEHTLERLAVFRAARETGRTGEALRAALEAAGVDDSIAAGIPRAIEYYHTTTAYLEAVRRLAVDALAVVAGEREEVRAIDVAPDEGGEATLGPLPEVDLDLPSDDLGDETTSTAEPDATQPVETSSPAAESTATEGSAATDRAAAADDSSTTAESPTEAEPTITDSTAESAERATEPAAESESATEPELTTESEPTTESESATEADPTGESIEPDAATSTDQPTESAEADAAASTDAAETGMYQLDDDEREELETEFGSGFSSGNDVGPAGEADIDVPDIDELAEEAEKPEESGETESEGSEATPEATETAGADERNASSEPVSDPDAGLEAFTAESDADSTGDDEANGDDEAARDHEAGDAGGDGASEDAGDDEPSVDVNLEDAAVALMAELDDGDGADRETIVSRLVETHGVEPASVEEAIADALMSGRCYEPDAGVLKSI